MINFCALFSLPCQSLILLIYSVTYVLEPLTTIRTVRIKKVLEPLIIKRLLSVLALLAISPELDMWNIHSTHLLMVKFQNLFIVIGILTPKK